MSETPGNQQPLLNVGLEVHRLSQCIFPFWSQGYLAL